MPNNGVSENLENYRRMVDTLLREALFVAMELDSDFNKLTAEERRQKANTFDVECLTPILAPGPSGNPGLVELLIDDNNPRLPGEEQNERMLRSFKTTGIMGIVENKDLKWGEGFKLLFIHLGHERTKRVLSKIREQYPRELIDFCYAEIATWQKILARQQEIDDDESSRSAIATSLLTSEKFSNLRGITKTLRRKLKAVIFDDL